MKGCPAWVFGNRNAKGYYRVYYQDAENLMNIAAAAERALQQSLERITNCIEFKQVQGDNMEKWLQQQGQQRK